MYQEQYNICYISKNLIVKRKEKEYEPSRFI
jgi:hypothetical protein